MPQGWRLDLEIADHEYVTDFLGNLRFSMMDCQLPVASGMSAYDYIKQPMYGEPTWESVMPISGDSTQHK